MARVFKLNGIFCFFRLAGDFGEFGKKVENFFLDLTRDGRVFLRRQRDRWVVLIEHRTMGFVVYRGNGQNSGWELDQSIDVKEGR